MHAISVANLLLFWHVNTMYIMSYKENATEESCDRTANVEDHTNLKI